MKIKQYASKWNKVEKKYIILKRSLVNILNLNESNLYFAVKLKDRIEYKKKYLKEFADFCEFQSFNIKI